MEQKLSDSHTDQLTKKLSTVTPPHVPDIFSQAPAPSFPSIDPGPSSPANEKLERLIGRMQRLNKAAPVELGSSAFFSPESQGSKISTGLKCPQCNKRALKRTKRVTLLDKIVVLAMLSPYHCRYCQFSEWRFMVESLENLVHRA